MLSSSVLFKEKESPYIPTLKVDLVALPDQLKKEKSSPALNPALQRVLEDAKKTIQKAEISPQKPIVKSTETVGLIQNHKTSQAAKNREALQRIKSLTQIQNWESDSHSQHTGHLIKGNQLSSGTSLNGEARESLTSDYRDQLRDRLNQNFQLPIWLKRQPLSARVQIYIAASGHLLRYAFENRSGNPKFDDLVIRAIEQSEPFPSPPLELRQKLTSRGILLRFPL